MYIYIYICMYVHMFIYMCVHIYIDPSGLGQYDGQGVYCDLSTASEVFLIFTTQLCKFIVFFFSICTI